jgi:O-antigen ligase
VIKKTMQSASFFILGFTHGTVIIPVLAFCSLIFFTVINFNSNHIKDTVRQRRFMIPMGIIVYLIINQFLHLRGSDFLSMAFYRSQGKPIYILLLFLAFCMVPKEKLIKHSVSLFAGFSSAVILLQIYLYIFRRDGSEIVFDIVGGHNVLAAFVGQVFLLFFVAYRMENRQKHKYILLGFSLISFTFFALQYSRGYTIGILAAITFAYYSTSKRGKNIYAAMLVNTTFYLLVIVAAFVAAFVVTPDRWANLAEDRNVLTRFSFWSTALEIIYSGFLFGGGLGSFSWINGSYESLGVPFIAVIIRGGVAPWLTTESEDLTAAGLSAHNVYLQTLVDMGFIGFCLWFLFIRAMLKYAFLQKKLNYDFTDVSSWLPLCGKFFGTLSITLIVFSALSGLAGGFTFFAPSGSFFLYFTGALNFVSLKSNTKSKLPVS